MNKQDHQAMAVQRFLKGYLTRVHLMKFFKEEKIDGNLQPLVTLRAKLRGDAGVFISYEWKKYLKRKAKKKKKTVTKGKKGKGKKK